MFVKKGMIHTLHYYIQTLLIRIRTLFKHTRTNTHTHTHTQTDTHTHTHTQNLISDAILRTWGFSCSVESYLFTRKNVIKRVFISCSSFL